MGTTQYTKIYDLTGLKFGRLTVIRRNGTKWGQRAWLCSCECGRETTVPARDIKSGNTKRCGQCRSDNRNQDNPAYWCWANMIQRCNNPKTPGYRNYGGRGIAVCDRWRDNFSAFLVDMGERPGPEYTIERIDNSLGYFPGNCRWATNSEQQLNKRNNRLLTFNGETLTVKEWSDRTGIPYTTIRYRLAAGVPVADALTLPVDHSPGQKKSLWSRIKRPE